MVWRKGRTCEDKVWWVRKDYRHMAALLNGPSGLDGSRQGEALRLGGQRDTREGVILTRSPGGYVKGWPLGAGGAGNHGGRAGVCDRSGRRVPRDDAEGLALQRVRGRRRQGGRSRGWHDRSWGG